MPRSAPLLAVLLLLATPAAALGAVVQPRIAVTITAAPPKLTTATTATFRFSRVGGTRVTCRIDRAAFAACSSPRRYRALRQGSHTFTVRVVAGRTVRSASYTWTVDSAGPTAPVVAADGSWRSASSGSALASGSVDAGAGLASYQHQVSTDGGVNWSPLLGGPSATATFEGVTLIRFRAVDKLGNASGWTQVAIRLDRHGPAAPSVGGGSSVWMHGPVDLHENGDAIDSLSGVAGYEVQTSATNGETWAAAQPVVGNGLTDSTDGALLARFRAVDAAGNRGPWSAAVLARVDATPPPAPVVTGGGAACQLLSSAPTLTGSGGLDALSGIASWAYRVSTDGGTTWTLSGSGNVFAPQGTGTYVAEMRTVDGAGNTGPWSAATAAASLCAI